MDIEAALDYLQRHINLETDVGAVAAQMRLARMAHMVELLGQPQRDYPVIHITGTNGKGSVARMITALLVGNGLAVGTYTSPHLDRVNERLAWNGEPIADEALGEVLADVALVEPHLASIPGNFGPPSYFELLTAAAFRWFADVAVDVAVVEVGLGGRRDATNVADAAVAVVTNVSLDHTEVIGPTAAEIAREKAGIIKAGSILVLGETEEGLSEVFTSAAMQIGAPTILRRDQDFGLRDNRLALGGRVVDLFTPGCGYDQVAISLHGGHQGDNASAALAAAEAFLGTALPDDVVREAFGSIRMPGRLEVVGRSPLCVIDGAHNPAGAAAASVAVAEAFAGVQGRVLVIGLLNGRHPGEMLAALDAASARLVVTCAPPSPRAMPVAALSAAAAALGVPVEEATSVAEALATALALAHKDELVLVTGSLYIVGAARQALRGLS